MGRQTVFGISIDRIDHPEAYGILALVCFLVVAIMVANMRRGRVGRRLIAVRTNERAAVALGINIVGAKLYAFGLASAFAALGGILYAFRSRSVDFATWSFGVDSIVLVGLAVIGGIGFTIGPLFGSILAAARSGRRCRRSCSRSSSGHRPDRRDQPHRHPAGGPRRPRQPEHETRPSGAGRGSGGPHRQLRQSTLPDTR